MGTKKQICKDFAKRLLTAFEKPCYSTSTVLVFGRYKGMTLGEVLDIDSKWVAWAVLDAKIFDVPPEIYYGLVRVRVRQKWCDIEDGLSEVPVNTY